jgi:capsular polysaccharide transport system permease protein
MVQAASEEVARAEARVKTAAAAVSSYRSDQSIFDPDRQSALQLQQASGIQESLVASRTQLAQLQAISPQNPQVPVLKNKIATLEAEMAKASGSVVGRKGSFAGKAPAYERLILEREFAEKQLASAMTSLETSRSQARRQQLYLERISQPSLPDKALEPRRIRGIITVFLVGMIMWGILALLLSAVREHRD